MDDGSVWGVSVDSVSVRCVVKPHVSFCFTNPMSIPSSPLLASVPSLHPVPLHISQLFILPSSLLCIPTPPLSHLPPPPPPPHTSLFLQEAHRKFKGWVHYDTVHDVEVSYLKLGDGVPLWLWKGTVEVQATHTAVFARLWNQRYTMFCSGHVTVV